MEGDASLKVTRIVHSCALVDFGGCVVLTDPWFSERPGYHRGEPLGASVEGLPELSGIVVSHAHYDHSDVTALVRSAGSRVPVVAERGAARRASQAGFKNVTTLTPWEAVALGSITATAVPASHGVPEIGYVLQARGFTVYFAGDTLLIPALSEIAERFPSIDVALLPINGLRILGRKVVMDPVQAAQLCGILHPRFAIPTHYAFTGGRLMDSLFLKYFDRQERLPRIFKDAVRQYAPETRAVVLQPGTALTIEGPATDHRTSFTGAGDAERAGTRAREQGTEMSRRQG